LSRSLLPLIPAALHVVQVLPTPDRITILTAPKPSSSAYPLCGAVSSRVHSHYTRTLADLPWQGRAVTVQVRARRFRCATAGCLRQVFAERLPGVAQSWARRTARLGDIQRHISLALGAEPGSRLAARLSMPVSGDTLLRLVQATEPEPPPSPRVVGGIVNFSLRSAVRRNLASLRSQPCASNSCRVPLPVGEDCKNSFRNALS